METFFPTLFDSLSVLFAAEPIFYILSIIALCFVLYVLRTLALD